MGRMFIEGMADLELGLPQMVAMHLQGNLYPSVPLSMVDSCVEAINAYDEWDFEREIELPEGVLYKGFMTTAPASALISNHRLESFLDNDEEF